MGKTVYIGHRGVIQILREAGFDDSRYVTLDPVGRISTLELAYCVVAGESDGDPWSTNFNGDDHPVKTWFPGGESHDCGLVQWNDYWWGADPTSELHRPDKATWYRLAYDPKMAARWLYAKTDGGTRNWSTWLAFNNESFLNHRANARAAIAAGPPLPFRKLVIGGRTSIRASSVASRCNPGVSVARWFRFNPTVLGPDGKLVYLTGDPAQMLRPGTTIKVPYWTTRIQAGSLLPEFAR
jgi:hypothetical protein